MPSATLHSSPFAKALLLLTLTTATMMTTTDAFRFSTPYQPWVAVLDQVDLKQLSPQELNLLVRDGFEKCPVMIFKNQSDTTASEFFELVKRFDLDVDLEDIYDKSNVLHPFPREPDAPHVGIRDAVKNSSDLGDQFRFGRVWHMDLVGSKKIKHTPNYVSAFHFLDTPDIGGETIFCNMDVAYASLPPDVRKTVDQLECIWDNDMHSIRNIRLDADGFTRLGPFPEDVQGVETDQIISPLVQRDLRTLRKRMFFSPVRFNRFVGWTREESWEFMTYLFHNYIHTPQNTAKVQWSDGDIAIFCNHRLMHTATPWEIYKGKQRRFRVVFLNSKKMYAMIPANIPTNSTHHTINNQGNIIRE